MISVEMFVEYLGADFYTGVPDSQLRSLCDLLYEKYGTDARHHVIAANEGNAVAIATGYHLATGKIPVVYMQNSGIGNATNPLVSLAAPEVYGIPMILVIGWRGESGVHDEPQHMLQGSITLEMLDTMSIEHFIVTQDTDENEVAKAVATFEHLLDVGKQVAFVVRKNALSYDKKIKYKNDNSLTREDAIRKIIEYTGEDIIISTTGKASRELFELRNQLGQDHDHDFLTVGSMGHSSSIALGIALQKRDRRIWCIDGDGAAIMHMGSLAVIGQAAPKPNNLVHIVINNGAHESVGGMPTSASGIEFTKIAEACGYEKVYSTDNIDELEELLRTFRTDTKLTMLEIRCAIGARGDLGRPDVTPEGIRKRIMKMLE